MKGKDALLMLAMTMADAITNRGRYEADSPLPIYCGDCRHCPIHGKTFCRFSKHNVIRNTPATRCEHFINKNIDDE